MWSKIRSWFTKPKVKSAPVVADVSSESTTEDRTAARIARLTAWLDANKHESEQRRDEIRAVLRRNIDALITLRSAE